MKPPFPLNRTLPGRAGVLAVALLTAAPLGALPPAGSDPQALLGSGKPVTSIPSADGVHGFEPLDGAHVMLSTAEDRYLLTLNRECFGLRWARHVGVTASDNTIWAGFDAVTADGEACAIREIHRLEEPGRDAL